jgi:hypothetical protein
LEKIVSKTNDTSKLRIEDVEASTLDLGGANTFTVRQFSDAELQQVSSGWSLNGIPGAAAPAETTPWNWRRMMDEPFDLKG